MKLKKALCGIMASSMILGSFPVQAEVILAREAAAATKDYVNVALGKQVTASKITSLEADAWQCPDDRITDGDKSKNSFWDSGNLTDGEEPEVVIDLGKTYELEQVNIFTYYDNKRHYQYEVLVSNDNANWQEVGKKDNEDVATDKGESYTFAATSARYVKVLFTGASVTSRHLLEVEALARTEGKGENLAVGKSVTASKTSEGNPANVVDGNRNTSPYWAASAPNPNHVVIDLERVAEINEIDVFPYYGNPRGYTYNIYVSEDGNTYELVAAREEFYKQLASGDKYAFANAVKGRYVKVEMTGIKHSDPNNTGVHLSEVEVYGKYEDTGEVIEANVAKNKPVTASVDNASYPASVITDGNTGGRYWDGGAAPAYYEIDLEDFYRINELKLFPYRDGRRGYHYTVYASDNGIDYKKIAEKTNDDAATANGEAYEIEEEVIARYVRVVMTYNTLAATSNNKSVHMHETEVYGEKVDGYIPKEPSRVDPEDADNIAYHKPTTANMNKKISSLVVDGMKDYGWTAKLYPANVEVDLEQAYDLSEIMLHFPTDGTYVYKYSVYGSKDGVDYSKLYSKDNEEPAGIEGDTITLTDAKDIRYVRVNVEYNSESSVSAVAEIKIHGTASEAVTQDKKDRYELEPYAESEYAEALDVQELLNGIVTRTVGEKYVDWFEFEEVAQVEEGKDFYRISNHNGKIKIEGTSGVAIASGLNYYYKYYCNVNITEVANQTKMPSKVVPVENAIEKESPYKVRYAFNYCTLSYTFPFYDLEDWQHELDWLALNGVNVVLDLAGQEAVWVLFLQELGYSYEDAKNWLAGPGYYAWQFMDNLEYINGPVPEGWIEDRVELARTLNQWKVSMGMQTVLQGYAGMLPTNVEEFISDETITDNLLPQGQWGGLDRPWMVRTDSEAYEILAEKFYEAQEIVYGKDNHYYAVDPFHEGGIRPNDLSDDIIAREVLENLVDKYDSEAVWMIQHWWSNPSKKLLEGIGDYRDDHAMILNLTAVPNSGDGAGSTGIPDDSKFNSTPWIYCMLESFGGAPSLDADLKEMSRIPELVEAKGNTTLQGIGIISEATLDVPAAYDLLWEMAWEDTAIDLDEWIKNYITRRYGAYSEAAYEAWMILKDTVYSRSRGVVHSLPSKNPDLNLNMDAITYSTADLEKALILFMNDYDKLSASPGYLFDLSELLAQVIDNEQYRMLSELRSAYSAKDIDSFVKTKEEFLESFDILDQVTSMNSSTLLGEWIGKATDFAENYDDFSMDMFKINAKALITTWKNSINKGLIDYSARNFSGLIEDLYKETWNSYLVSLENNLKEGTPVTKPDKYEAYWAWILNDKEYTRETLSSVPEIKALVERVFDGVVNLDEKDLTFVASVEASKEVNSPDSNGGYAKYAVDGSLSSYWDGGSVNDSPEIILDFKNIYQLESTQIIPYFAGNNRYYHYEVYASTDKETWTKVAEKNTNEIQTQDGETFELNVNARYLKVVGKYNSRVQVDKANDSFHVVEWKVSGKPVQASADKEDLAALIQYAKDAQEAPSYAYLVPKVKALFEKALADADAVNKDAAATQAEVDAAYDALLAKVHLLDFTGNAETLQSAISIANGMIESEYTKESWAPFKAAREAAQAVLDDVNALQEEIDAARDELQAKMNALVEITVNKEKLKKLVADAAKYETEIAKYTKDTAAAFTAALEGARDVLKTAEKQEEVNSAYSSLLSAIFGLREVPNKDKLESLLEKVKAMDLSAYSAKTASAVKAAYAAAVAVFEDENADQEKVDAAVAALESAVKAASDDKATVSDEKDETSKSEDKVAAEGAGNKTNTTGKTTNKTAGNTAAKTGDGANAAIPVAAGLAAVLAVLAAWKKK